MQDRTVSIAIAGLGKIARDQHVPAIRADARFRLVATASLQDTLPDVPGYASLAQLQAAQAGVAAVSVCTTPQVRFEVASLALAGGSHVLLEKPPCATLGEVESLVALAERRGVTLLAAWHSRFASGVEPARAWLAGRRIQRVAVRWKEDVRKWHPGQLWIWQAGGMGVFDPGINALSILTHLLPGPLRVRSAELRVPANCETAIAATLALEGEAGVGVACEFDFRHVGEECWDIDVHTDSGLLQLSQGGAVLRIDGRPVQVPAGTEYARAYDHFARLVAAGASDVDVAPLRIVADALLCGRPVEVEPFVDDAAAAGGRHAGTR